jgi:hypothetical protein
MSNVRHHRVTLVSIALPINAAIDRLAELEGKAVAVEGLLDFEFEDISLWHWPKVALPNQSQARRADVQRAAAPLGRRSCTR